MSRLVSFSLKSPCDLEQLRYIFLRTVEQWCASCTHIAITWRTLIAVRCGSVVNLVALTCFALWKQVAISGGLPVSHTGLSLSDNLLAQFQNDFGSAWPRHAQPVS